MHSNSTIVLSYKKIVRNVFFFSGILATWLMKVTRSTISLFSAGEKDKEGRCD